MPAAGLVVQPARMYKGGHFSPAAVTSAGVTKRLMGTNWEQGKDAI